MEQKFALVKIESLENIYQLLNEIKKKLDKDDGTPTMSLKEWVTEEEAMVILKVKSTSLYKLRKSKQIIATKTRPVFYNLQSIKSYLLTMSNG